MTGGVQGACMPHMPPLDTTRYGQSCAGSTHPTGMHSCLDCKYQIKYYWLLENFI